LETAIARFKGTEASLVFGSGYLANTGLIPALIGKGGLILADRLIHASLFDGCHLSGADLRIFGHNDVEQIGTLLSRRSASRPTLIVTEGVFSMDGDLAALPAICDLADRYEAVLYVDDAHGTGVMGPQGRGTSEHFGVAARLPFHVGTLGKALGTSGGYIAGPSDTVAYCLNVARTFLFSTAPPPAIAAATEAAIHIIDQDPDRRTRLWDNRRYMVDGLAQLDYRTTATQSPIVPILIGSAKRACAVSERLLDAGIYAPAIRPPTVPPGSSRIRLTISSEHSRDDIDHLLLALRNACRDTPAS
jgi:glycine C-acetyltransferase/8-amino-7-oxononanoate synthase